eukprot:TRINITY_DN1511_c0_g1_i1.p1 TRINITY_DN1511_c0_g1~~TRINITY_DN1511_c0_g1_i1.p1  ORF type:complete len:976 (-),score=279.06 TRINITY_DN1511_c0_g1_i1:21-2702(-)
MEALNLLSSQKFQEKVMGYLAMTVLLHENHEMLPLIIQSLQNDLQSRNEFHQCLALTAISNIGGKEMSESLAPIVQKLLVSKSTKAATKKKAAVCLLRLFRKYPELLTADPWAERISTLLDEPDMGLLTSIVSLLLGLAAADPKGYEPCQKKVIWLLTKIIINKDYTKDYLYYNIANPWLQVKLLRFLSFYAAPTDSTLRTRLYEILKKILGSVDVAKGQTVNHKNALNAVLFEAIDLVMQLDDDRETIRSALGLLGRFISAKEHSNIRYLALEALGHIGTLDSESSALVKRHQDTVILALRDPDISIRKRALDLLYGMCDKNNAKGIVSEMLSYLLTADFQIRDELVLKIAILAEKFAANYSWYVDVILQLIALAGDFVSDDIWYRVVQIVTNHEDVQKYAAQTIFQAVQQKTAHETAVKVGAYILGEFGHLISETPGSGPKDQFDALFDKYASASLATRALMLTTYVKFVNLYPELTQHVRSVFQQNQTSFDAEIQQRSCEYLRLTLGSEELLQTVWDVMPAFPERPGLRMADSDSTATPKRERSSTGGNTSTPPASPPPLHNVTPAATVSVTPSVTATSPAPPPKSNHMKDLEDIFAIGNEGTAAQPALAPSNVMTANHNAVAMQAAVPVHQDLMGLNPIPVASQGANYPSRSNPDLTKKCFSNAEGLLYQDEFLQIGFKSEFSKGMGRVMLYYGNVSSHDLQNITATVTSSPNVVVNPAPMASVLPSKNQGQQMVMVTAVSGFAETPHLQLSFQAGGVQHQFSLALPVVLTKFTEPTGISGPQFFQAWRETENPPLSDSVILKPASGNLSVPYLSDIIARVFHLSVLQNVDPNGNNIVAAGNLVSSKGADPVLLRIETNPQAGMYRVTFRSTDPQITSGLKDLVSQLLV